MGQSTTADRSLRPKGAPDRPLTQAAFDQLLARLDPDREEAGRQYNQLRRKLIHFIGVWGCSSPEELADEALDRTARKMLQGEAIQNVSAYVLKVARFVNQEMVKRQIQERKAVQELRQTVAEDRDAVEYEKRLSCYEQCLSALAANERELFLKYYQDEGRRRARHREQMCLQFGITMNLLRVRAFRVRKSIADYVQGCLERSSQEM